MTSLFWKEAPKRNIVQSSLEYYVALFLFIFKPFFRRVTNRYSPTKVTLLTLFFKKLCTYQRASKMFYAKSGETVFIFNNVFSFKEVF